MSVGQKVLVQKTFNPLLAGLKLNPNYNFWHQSYKSLTVRLIKLECFAHGKFFQDSLMLVNKHGPTQVEHFTVGYFMGRLVALDGNIAIMKKKFQGQTL